MPSFNRSNRTGSHSSRPSSRPTRNRAGSHFDSTPTRPNMHLRPMRRTPYRSALYHAPRIYVSHGRKYTYTKKTRTSSSVFSVLMVIAFIVIAVGLVMMFNSISAINTIKADRDYYLNMIEHAETDSRYVREAEVLAYRNGDSGKYYIIYRIEGLLDGYSYQVYTEEQAMALYGETIRVAVSTPTLNDSTDSIPMDYKDFPLDADGEYIDAANTRKTYMIVSIAGAGAFVILLIANIATRAKGKQYIDETGSNADATSLSTINSPSKQDKKNPIRKCEYCGTILNQDDVKCPNCGAQSTTIV